MKFRSLSSRNIAAGLMLVLSTAAIAVPANRTREPAETEPAPTEEKNRNETWRKPLGELAQVTEMCQLIGEQKDGKMRFCFYTCPSGKMHTIVRVHVCPATYEK
ncbi:MAG: hypothetical protein CAPSK01_001982 [Candidatus Accumulibacter vicinus]|uniref:Secreted protein n=1 Tax=Candidatus Accumulibacter vicinus TaxID=2954382 RepID=A0A084Y086_9PROT|nr:MAG: hypothetical protein CAPSK01_001982 [Candidatus Accumulibacter vicinus]